VSVLSHGAVHVTTAAANPAATTQAGGAVVDTAQRLGVFGFAQCNVIYDFYQREVNVLDTLADIGDQSPARSSTAALRGSPAPNAVERDVKATRFNRSWNAIPISTRRISRPSILESDLTSARLVDASDRELRPYGAVGFHVDNTDR
jgi:hypothetical protein